MGNNPIGTIDPDGRNGVPVVDKDGNVTYYLPDVDFCPGCEEQHTYSSGFWEFMGRLDALVQGNAYINDAPFNIIINGKRGTGDNGWKPNPNAPTIHIDEETAELITMILARANPYTHKDGRTLTDQRNTSVNKYTTNSWAKEISVKSRLEIALKNLVEVVQAKQSEVHGIWYNMTYNYQDFKYRAKNSDSLFLIFGTDVIGDSKRIDTTVIHKNDLKYYTKFYHGIQ